MISVLHLSYPQPDSTRVWVIKSLTDVSISISKLLTGVARVSLYRL